MSENLRKDADRIIDRAIKESLPDSAVRKALQEFPETKGKVVLIAVGKAAWQMADAAYGFLGERITSGVVVTKYDHSKGRIGNLEIYEGGPEICLKFIYIFFILWLHPWHMEVLGTISEP